MKCTECGEEMSSEENYHTSKEPICGICWDAMHYEEPDTFSDADPGL